MLHPQGRMTKLSLLAILGTCITFAAIVISDPIPVPTMSPQLLKCKMEIDVRAKAATECYRRENTEEQRNETLRMFPDTKCLSCKHMCRKQDLLTQCMRNDAESLRNISNKSIDMVPLIAEMLETTLITLCENDGDMMNVQEEDKECFRGMWKKCKTKLSFMDDLNILALCDSEEEENDPFTKDNVCQNVAEFFQCSEGEGESCSPKVKTHVSRMKSQMSSLDSCDKNY
ncbi:uncharacterized protein LOC124154354 isoform X2 [Ischnura elegans]|uniref:uncharacterized protein LOC124154354 isoform X2 n=1 Tax=Ischnura elegans TaxID=197161 RepID=UPI001ED86767|nr:uncharacterized protein LOC124154354 isoform X2 [Ischnura elegans]